MGKAYDPKDVQDNSNWSVQYVVQATGDPLFQAPYERTTGGAATEATGAANKKADRDRHAELLAPDGVELVNAG